MPKKATKPEAVTAQLAGAKAFDTLDVIAQMIWKMRHSLPGPVIQITAMDRQAFKDSLNYNEQQVKVVIEDRNGSTLVHLTDQTNNQIIFTENNEADLDKAQAAASARQVKQSVPGLISRLRNELATGDFANSTVEEALLALSTLSK